METVQSADGTTIAYDRTGDGPPLVVVTGALSDRMAPSALARVLGKDLTVYAYDRRGRGASGDTLDYAVEREIEDLAAVITAAGGSANVFGHSSGAALCLEAAARGLPISRLAVYEPPYIVDDSRPRLVGMYDRVRELIASGRGGEALRVFLTEAVEMPESEVDAMQAEPVWSNMEAIVHTVPYDLAILGDHRMPADRFSRLAVPTLVIGGGASPRWMRNTMTTLAATVPGARQVSLEGQTHGAADDVLAPVLVEFLLS